MSPEPFLIVKHDQGSDAWKKWRQTRITASEIACIAGVPGAFSSPGEVWLRKTGRSSEQGDNRAMARGRIYEPHLRRFVEEAYKKPLLPVCVESREREWVAASLDGLSEDGADFWEFKIPGEKTHAAVREHGLPGLLEVAEKYFCQVQWQDLALGGSAAGHYASAFGLPFVDQGDPLDFDGFCQKAEVIAIDVPVDRDYQQRLLVAGERFYNLLGRKIVPGEELSDIVREFRSGIKAPASSESIEKLAGELGLLLEQQEAIKGKIEPLRKKVLAFAENSGAKSLRIGELVLKRTDPKQKVSMDLLKDSGIDLSPYEIPSLPGWKISRE